MARQKTSRPVKIKLDPRLDAAATEGLQTTLLEKRVEGRGLAIDVSNVTLIDTPAIQVLMAAGADQAAKQQVMKITGESEAFTDALALLGLAQQFETWSTVNG